MTESDSPEAAVRWIVSGRVQGIGFRFSVARYAMQLGVKGWVRNRSDGSVEVEAQGEAESLDRLQEYLRSGPPMARVDNVDTSDVPHEVVVYKSFTIK